MAQKKIVILGGGMGGIVTARDLRKHLGKEHRIILIDKNAFHTFQPSYLWIVIGWRTPAAITKSYSSLQNYGIEFFNACVLNVDIENKKVETDNGKVDFDYLIIALGAENDIPQLFKNQNGIHMFYTFEKAVELSKTIPTFTGGTIAIVQTEPNIKYPLAPYEAALLISSFYSKRGISNVQLKIFVPEITPFPCIGDENNQHLLDLLKQHNIEFFLNQKSIKVDTKSKKITSSTNLQIPYDLVIGIPSCKPPELLIKSKLSDSSGWIKVNKHTLETDHPNVWAIGDNTIIRLSNGEILPKAGIFANNQAEVVAYNIAQQINGTSQKKTFSGYGFFFIETGNGRASYLHGNFFTEPNPSISWLEPNVTFHWGKVVLEKYWLWRWL